MGKVRKDVVDRVFMGELKQTEAAKILGCSKQAVWQFLTENYRWPRFDRQRLFCYSGHLLNCKENDLQVRVPATNRGIRT